MAMNPRLLRPTASGGFTPNKIAGLQLWLDAADSSTISTGTGVSEWRDKSATGSKWAQTIGNEQPATGTQTMNGKNVIAFDGSNDSLSASTPLSTSMPLTMFVVQRIVAGTTFGMTYTAGSGDNFNIRQSSTFGNFTVIAGGSAFVGSQDGNSRVGNDDILSMVFPAGAGTTGAAFIDGSSYAPSGSVLTAKPTLTGTHYIGRRSDGFYANVRIAEIIAYSTELSTLQRKAVESYLGKKWGITVA